MIHKLSFLLEFFYNGVFILLHSMIANDKIPKNWNLDYIKGFHDDLVLGVPFVIFFTVISNIIDAEDVDEFIRKYSFSFLVFIPTLITWGDREFTFLLSAAHLLSTILSLYDDDGTKEKKSMQFSDILKRLRLSSPQIVLFSFAGVILLGTFFLMLPFSTNEGKSISFLDALFTATSATCVTGLSTINIGQDLTLFGQLVLLLLIQIGGLSIMTLYSSMAIFLGRTMRMNERIIMQDFLDVSSLEELFAMIGNIIKYTFLIELWGGIVLTIAFTFEGFDFGQSLYYGFFHSISAFCNAGFALFDNSLENYATNPLIHGTISVLIILGGIGFIVLKELTEIIVKKKTIVRLTMHSKIVIVTTLFLTFGGALFIFFGEFLGALDGYTLWEKAQISFFQSVTLRTAGFNTIPLNNLNSYTIYIMALIMFIGGSPGSTAGGVKTTTLAILAQSIISTLRGSKTVNFFDRSISGPMVVRATALMFISIIITSFFIFIMMNIESDQAFLPLFFEVISASGTVGLTLGVTPFLTTMGKVAISVLMLIGRIGPLTLILAIGERQKTKGRKDLPEGRILIG